MQSAYQSIHFCERIKSIHALIFDLAKKVNLLTQMRHVWKICQHLPQKNVPNAGKYTEHVGQLPHMDLCENVAPLKLMNFSHVPDENPWFGGMASFRHIQKHLQLHTEGPKGHKGGSGAKVIV